VRDHEPVTRTGRALLAVGLCSFLGGSLIAAVALLHPADADPGAVVLTMLIAVPSMLLGLMLVRHRPENLTGPALVVLGAVPCLVVGVETWGSTVGAAEPWPLATVMAQVSAGIWVFHLAGFVVLCLVFPVGPLGGRPWNLVPAAYLAVATLLIMVRALDPTLYSAGGGLIPGAAPLAMGDGSLMAFGLLSLVSLLAVLFTAASAQVVRYRRGPQAVREQVRWFMAGALSVPILLGAGWIAQGLGASTTWSYTGFLLAVMLVLPATVYLAIQSRDLLDIDRLLSQGSSWFLTAVVAAGLFTSIVAVLSRASGIAAGWGPTVATFVTALVLLPLHQQLHRVVGRTLDHDRTVAIDRVVDFVRRTRAGQAQPEEVEEVLRGALDDPGLQLLICIPGSEPYFSLDGRRVDPPAREIPLEARGDQVGALVLGHWSARRERLAREAVAEARLPIEVSRMRLELRRALDEVRASRARLVEAVSEERVRLERDLHDGAQQQLVAVGMRLRSIQHRWPQAPEADAELDAAVLALEDTVTEIRRLANGVRPGRLADGLGAAVRGLVHSCPVPVHLDLAETDPDEPVADAAYYVVAESLANTLKHASASSVDIGVRPAGGRLRVTVQDDGSGGAVAGTGLTRLRDRVEALGGQLTVTSPPGHGTTVEAVL
jgi:signal transduction histidine kinase